MYIIVSDFVATHQLNEPRNMMTCLLAQLTDFTVPFATNRRAGEAVQKENVHQMKMGGGGAGVKKATTDGLRGQSPCSPLVPAASCLARSSLGWSGWLAGCEKMARAWLRGGGGGLSWPNFSSSGSRGPGPRRSAP